MSAQRQLEASLKWLYNRFSGNQGVAPEYSFDNNKALLWRNAANSGDVTAINVDANNTVQYGGTNSNGVTLNAGANFGVLATPSFFENMNVPASLNTAGAVNPIPNTSLINGIYLRNTAGAARTDVTDTAANIVGAIQLANPNAGTNTTFNCMIVNISNAANAVTLSGGTNVTIANVAAVANNTSKMVLGVITGTSPATVTIYPT